MFEYVIAAFVAVVAVGLGVLAYETRLHRKAIEEAIDADAEAMIVKVSDAAKKIV
jgi:hypothetical protein